MSFIVIYYQIVLSIVTFMNFIISLYIINDYLLLNPMLKFLRFNTNKGPAYQSIGLASVFLCRDVGHVGEHYAERDSKYAGE